MTEPDQALIVSTLAVVRAVTALAREPGRYEIRISYTMVDGHLRSDDVEVRRIGPASENLDQAGARSVPDGTE